MKAQATRNTEIKRRAARAEIIGCSIAVAMFFMAIALYTRIIPMMILGGGQ